MSIQEAIKHGKDQLDIFGGEHREFIELAIKSLEKENPRMVNYGGDGYADGYMVYDMAECPACGNRIDEEDVDVWEVAKYCPECGQRIIWGGDEE